MDDIRFRLGFWDIVIQKENLIALCIIAIILVVAILSTVIVGVCAASNAKAIESERLIEANVKQFIADYSTISDANDLTLYEPTSIDRAA